MIVIPAIDLLNERVVRLKQGNYSQVTSYSQNPVDLALQFQADGFSRLHLVDLEGARSGKVVHQKVLKTITEKTDLIVDFGGGVKSEKDLEMVFNAGARQVNIGTLAVQDPELVGNWILKYGADRFILSADVRDGKVHISGWTAGTGKSIEMVIQEFIPFGLKAITCTDINKDGMMSGPSVNLYKNLKDKYPDMQIIASGGVSNIDDLLALSQSGCFAAIAGKSILDGKITAAEILKNKLSL